MSVLQIFNVHKLAEGRPIDLHIVVIYQDGFQMVLENVLKDLSDIAFFRVLVLSTVEVFWLYPDVEIVNLLILIIMHEYTSHRNLQFFNLSKGIIC